jgi:glutamate--cysteine ligase regulatory subunit
MTNGPSIIRRNGGEKSNQELVNSLRANFVAAQQDYSPPLSASATPPEDGTPGTRNPPRPPASIWTTRENDDFYIPTIDWSLSGLAEERSQYDITVKLFYLPGASLKERAQLTKDAVNLVLKELGVKTIDLLIVSFPGMSFEGDCEWEADKKNAAQGNAEDELATWPIFEELHEQGVVKALGLAEFGSEKLSRFLDRVKVRPVVDQINVKDCCNVPPPLIKLAKQENIELLTHNDCNEILPSGTLRELLGQGPKGAGVISELKRSADGSTSEITPKWVAKYTAVVQDRGVIENKGYFAAAELAE